MIYFLSINIKGTERALVVEPTLSCSDVDDALFRKGLIYFLKVNFCFPVLVLRTELKCSRELGLYMLQALPMLWDHF